MRADIVIHSGQDYKSALGDMDMAIKLQPENAGFYINRAYLRYMTDDIYGAFDDYEHALKLNPLNTLALFNRGLLRAEVHDTNKAIEDFSSVINLNPDDYKTLYNRSILLAEIGDFDSALADLNRVIEAYPDFAAAYFLRYDIKRRKGDMASAEKDYNKSLALAKQTYKSQQTVSSRVTQALQPMTAPKNNGDNDERPQVTETQEQVKNGSLRLPQSPPAQPTRMKSQQSVARYRIRISEWNSNRFLS